MIHSSRISGGSTNTLNLTGGGPDHSFNDDEEKAKLLLGMVQQPKYKDKIVVELKQAEKLVRSD